MIVIFLGTIFGIITGLLPGIHINMVSMFVLVNASLILNYFNLDLMIIFIISMSLIHTFVDFIPSIVFGIPNSDTALSVLPAHRMVLDGEGYKALFLSCLGSLLGAIVAILVAILFYFTLNYIYSSFKTIVPYFLILSITLLLLTEPTFNKKFWSFIIILFSGGYGLLILNSKLLNEPLLVLFSGIFGVSTIIFSIIEGNSNYPKQNFDFEFKFSKNLVKGVIVGTISSTICSITPGIGNSQAGILSSIFFRNLKSELFLVVLGLINTLNFVVSLITFYVIDRARNGSIYVISQLIMEITLEEVLFYFSIIFFLSPIAFIITMKLGKYIILKVEKLNLKIINLCILIFILILVYVFSSYYGLLVLFGASCLGLLCILLDVRRVHLMNILLIPILFNLI